MSASPQALLQFTGVKPQTFAPNSRYLGVPTTTLITPDGRTVAYVTRRFVPSPGEFSIAQQHSVAQGDRLDNLAAQYLGDPELFWQLCDSNGALWPGELTATVGRVLAIPLPRGIPGLANG